MNGTFAIVISNEVDEDQKAFLEDAVDEYLYDVMLANDMITEDSDQEWTDEHEVEFHTKMARRGSTRVIH